MDSTKICCGIAGWAILISVIDAGSREIVACRFSRRGRAIEAIDAIEQSLIRTYSSLNALKRLISRSDNASIFLARDFIKTAKRLNINQEFTSKYSRGYNGSIERFFRTLKQKCVWLNNFGTLEEAESIISEWIRYYNKE